MRFIMRSLGFQRKLLGKPIYPHLLRDCAASAMSSDAPEYILAASRILGHSSLKTTLSHYEQSSMLAAGARLVEHMSALQAKLEAEAPEAFFDEVVFDTLEEIWNEPLCTSSMRATQVTCKTQPPLMIRCASVRERLDQDQIAGSRCVRRPRDQWQRTTDTGRHSSTLG